jgi:hypothetical protein
MMNIRFQIEGMGGFSISTGGQQEVHLVLRSPVKDEVNKNSTEPKVEMRLVNGCMHG